MLFIRQFTFIRDSELLIHCQVASLRVKKVIMEDTQNLFEDILDSQVAHAVLTVLVCFVGLVGNFLISVNITRNREKWTSLNCFIGSIAVSDALNCLLRIANTSLDVLDGGWKLGKVTCQIKSFLQALFFDLPYVTAAISLVILLFRPRTRSQTSLKIAAAVWLVMSIIASPFGWYAELITFESFSNQTFCAVKGTSHLIQFMIEDFYDAINGLMLAFTIIVYIVCVVLRKVLQKDFIHDTRQNRILLLVLIVFGLRWIPFRIWYNNRHEISYSVLNWSLKLVNLCSLLAMGFNPFLLAAIVEGFRKDMMRLINGKMKQSPIRNNYNLLNVND